MGSFFVIAATATPCLGSESQSAGGYGLLSSSAAETSCSSWW